jgi:hypothetical protein
MAQTDPRGATVVARALVTGAIAAAAVAFIVALVPSSIGGVDCPAVLGNGGGVFITETGEFDCAAATSGKAGAVWIVWMLAAGMVAAAAVVKYALPEPNRGKSAQPTQQGQASSR